MAKKDFKRAARADKRAEAYRNLGIGRWHQVTPVRQLLPGKRSKVVGSPLICDDRGVPRDASERADLFLDFLIAEDGNSGLWTPDPRSVGPMPPELQNIFM